MHLLHQHKAVCIKTQLSEGHVINKNKTTGQVDAAVALRKHVSQYAHAPF